MASILINAAAKGYSSRTVLNHLMKKYPQYATQIQAAEAAGYTADRILKHLSRDKSNGDSTDQYLTEHERTQKRDKNNRRNAALGLGAAVVGTLGAAGALASAGMQYAARNAAVQPSQILPAPQRPGPTPQGPVTLQGRGPRGPMVAKAGQIAGQQQKGIGYNPQQPPQGGAPNPRTPRGTPPAPTTPNAPIIPPYEHDPQTNIALVKNIREDKRINDAIQSGLSLAAVEQALRQTIPKSKLALLDRAPGGFNQVLQDYAEGQLSETNRQDALQQFNQRRERPPSLIQEEMQRFQEQYPEAMEQEAAEMPQEMQQMPQEAISPVDQAQVQQRTQQAIQGVPLSQPEQIREINPKSFYVPNYRAPGESGQDFANRKIIYSAVNKAAKAITEGESFLNYLPNAKDTTLSTAVDVLRFIAGVPNVYNDLLDDEDRNELFNAFGENEGLRPSPRGDTSIHGAQLAPNLVWNLLIAQTPQLLKMEKPPSVKGYKMAPGKKMGTSELRRSLTHLVYGVLSGQTISSELADKIGRISSATAHLDAIVKATKEGNRRKMDEEMERLLDDDYFAEVMAQAIEEEMKINISEEKAKEDTKTASAIKAKATREKNKKAKEHED